MADANALYVNPKVQYIGVHKMRFLSTENLEALKEPLVVVGRESGRALAVVVPFDRYQELQERGRVDDPASAD